MVRFKVDLVTPGLQRELLVADGSVDFSRVATVLVGPNKTSFKLPVNHLTSIGHFKRAFSGSFSEAQSQTTELSEDDPAAFALFVEWLSRGIPNPHTMHKPVITWTRFLLLMDKFCLREQADNVAKYISNAMFYYITPAAGHYREDLLEEVYELLSAHAYRYISVHIVWIIANAIGADVPPGLFADQPDFFVDYFRWANISRAIELATRTYDYEEDMDAKEKDAHGLEQVLAQIFTRSQEFPALLEPFCSRVDERQDDEAKWKALQGFLNIDL